MDKQIAATNRKAYHEYHILDTYEAGMELLGSEVKSLREGNANLKEAYVVIRKGQALLIGVHIKTYSHAGFEAPNLFEIDDCCLINGRFIKSNQHWIKKG